MKKLIAIALMVVCAAGFSMGCKEKAKETKPTTGTETTAPAGDAAETPAAETPAAETPAAE